MSLTFETEEKAGNAVVLALVGSADLAAGEPLDRALAGVCGKRPSHVVLDLSELGYLASVCIGVIIRHQRACNDRGAKLTLAAPSPLVDGALRAAKLEKVLPIEPSVAAALASGHV